MGDAVLTTLANIREEVADALTEAGIKATHYVNENFVPPICIVIPNDPYVSRSDRFGMWTVSLQVLVIGGKGTNKTASDKLDSQIQKVVEALGHEALSEVGQPGEVSINGAPHLAAVVSLELETNFIEEVI